MHKILYTSLLVLPIGVSAAFFENTQGLLDSTFTMVQTLTVLAVALALLFFFWGLAQFILKSGDAASHEEGKNKMVWGVIALFVMVSIWGIVGFIQSELGVGGSGLSSDDYDNPPDPFCTDSTGC